MIPHLRRQRSYTFSGFRTVLASLILCFSLLALPSCDPPKNTGTTKSKVEEDEPREEGKRPETEVKKDFPPKKIQSVDKLRIPNTPAGQAVMVHFEAAYMVGEGAEKNYATSLNRLRRESKEVIEILNSAYGDVDQYMYADRWLILQTMADMKVEEGLEPLVKYANASLPQLDSIQYTDNISTYEEESVLRITAIRGIADLAPEMDKAAESMSRFFKHKDPVIRLEALNSFADAIRTIRDRKRQAQLVKFFPKDYIFEIKPINPDPIPLEEDPKLQPKGEGKGAPPKK